MNGQLNQVAECIESDFDEEWDDKWTKDEFLGAIREEHVSIKAKSRRLHDRYDSERTSVLLPLLLATYAIQTAMKDASRGKRQLSDAIAQIDATNVDELMAECAKDLKEQLAALREAIVDVVANTNPDAKDPIQKRDVKQQYFNPADLTQTWSGCGREPAWIKPFRLSKSIRSYAWEVNILNIEAAQAKFHALQSPQQVKIINLDEARNSVLKREGHTPSPQ